MKEEEGPNKTSKSIRSLPQFADTAKEEEGVENQC
jgi:hypothetical protein